MNSSLFGYSLFSFLYQELHMCIHPNRENERAEFTWSEDNFIMRNKIVGISLHRSELNIVRRKFD